MVLEGLAVAKQVATPFETEWVELIGDDERIARVRKHLDGLVHPQLESVMASGVETLGIPERGVGVAALLAMFRVWLESFESYTVERFDFRELPDGRLLSAAPVKAKMTNPGIEIELEIGTLWTVREGLVVRLGFYMTPEDAEKAARL